MNGLNGVNVTNFFNRELLMYSMGDIKFQKPVSLKKVAYTMGFIGAWTFPIYLLYGIQFDVFFLALMFVPPILAGHFSTKPVFGGKTLLEFSRTMLVFAKEPKGWTDLQSNNHMEGETFFADSEIWISRRRELRLLQQMKDARETGDGKA